MSFYAMFVKLDRGPRCKAEVSHARPAKAGWDHGEFFFGPSSARAEGQEGK
jgi:hypothetical protein